MSQIPRLHPGTQSTRTTTTDPAAKPATAGTPHPDPWAKDHDDWPAHRAHPSDVHDQSPLRSLGEAVSDVVRSTAKDHPLERALDKLHPDGTPKP